MDVIYYILIFIMGTVFGSFFTLAVYRIPLKKDITHERSFCPNCNHRLEFRDLIPILSYLCAKGKCRYCGQKIRPRYLILEVTSGLVFLLEFMFLHITGVSSLSEFIIKVAYFVSFVFMYVTVALIAGIDKEYRKINLGVLLFGIITQGIYMLYLYIFEGLSLSMVIYRYGIYLVLIIIFGLIDVIISKKKNRDIYAFEVLVFACYLGACVGLIQLACACILSAVLIGGYYIYLHFKNKSKKSEDKKSFTLNIGFWLGVTTVFMCMLKTYIVYR